MARTQDVPVRLGRRERAAVRALAAATVAFGLYGFVTGARGTVEYLLTVAVLAAVAAACWGADGPRWLAVALPVLGVAHLAGGLVGVGHDVLYNASFGAPALRYDHLVHASAIFAGTVVLWSFFVPTGDRWARPRSLVMLTVLAGLGLGALNETIEFLTTLAHHGSHVGGYANTGWDLVCNVVGGLTAGWYIAVTRRAEA